MQIRALLWISFLLWAGCCSSQYRAYAAPKLAFGALSTTENADERAYMSNMYALFRIVDPGFSDRVLRKAPDFFHFQNRVNDWIEHNHDRWSEIESRLGYARSLLQKGELGTDIDAPEPDIRWRLFIENGAPQEQLILQNRFRRSGELTTVWTILWPPDDKNEREQEISCWSQPGQDYPTEIIPADDKDFPVASPIWPFVNCSQFPAGDGTVDLWFSIWVQGDQLTLPTLDEGLLTLRIDLYDVDKTTLIASGEQMSDLQIIRGILKATKDEDRDRTRAMGYLGFSGVHPGSYKAHLTIRGAECNEGDEWIAVEVPREKKISDLLILGQSMVRSEDMWSGIIRGRLTGLYDNPECCLAPRAKFGLYLEAELPSERGRSYDVRVTLLRVPEVSRRMAGLVANGTPIVVADSLNRPFRGNEWQSLRNEEILEAMAESVAESRSSKAVTLLEEKFDAPEQDAVTVTVAPQLSSDLKDGRYLLTVTMSDSEGRSFYLSAQRFIHIESKRTSAGNFSLLSGRR